MQEITLKKTKKDIPFREWVSEKQEVYVFLKNDKIIVINGICPHFGGELYYNLSKDKILCNLHSLSFCPKNMTSNHKTYKKIQSFKVVNDDPIKIII